MCGTSLYEYIGDLFQCATKETYLHCLSRPVHCLQMKNLTSFPCKVRLVCGRSVVILMLYLILTFKYKAILHNSMLGMASPPFEIPFLFTGHVFIGTSPLRATLISLWERENPTDKRSHCVSVKVSVVG